MTKETEQKLKDALALINKVLESDPVEINPWEPVPPIRTQLKMRRKYLLNKGIDIPFPKPYISRIETGKTNPGINLVEEIARAMDCHLELVPNS